MDLFLSSINTNTCLFHLEMAIEWEKVTLKDFLYKNYKNMETPRFEEEHSYRHNKLGP